MNGREHFAGPAHTTQSCRLIRSSAARTIRPGNVRLAREAYGAWTMIEDESGEALILRTGGLDLGPISGAALDMEEHAASMALGFKFAGVLRRIMAELVTQGSSTSDIEAFRFDRAAGTEPIA
jgi:hypothetical protein